MFKTCEVYVILLVCFWYIWCGPYFLSVYRFYTSVLFHGSLLHVLFNMLTFVPLGTELERIMGSVRLLFLIFLLATTNAIFHLIVAFLVDYNPIYPGSYLVNECSIGFSGVIFSMIVIETSLSGVQYRRYIASLVCNDTLILMIYMTVQSMCGKSSICLMFKKFA
jgi:membrane associated rhomboid family serine protease